MLDKKMDFKCNDCGVMFDACVGLGIRSKMTPSKHDRFEQKWYWGN